MEIKRKEKKEVRSTVGNENMEAKENEDCYWDGSSVDGEGEGDCASQDETWEKDRKGRQHSGKICDVLHMYLNQEGTQPRHKFFANLGTKRCSPQDKKHASSLCVEKLRHLSRL